MTKTKEGFVYILVNSAMDGLVKIGLTRGESRQRAKQLRSTGVPARFIVVYDELVSDCRAVEKELHEKFAPYRYEEDREFFAIPPKEAVLALQQLVGNYQIPRGDFSVSQSIIDDLRKKFGKFVKKDITQARIVQTEDLCFFEIIREPFTHYKDQIIERTDLSVIAEEDGKMFDPSNTPIYNADKFVMDMDSASILNCVDNLFDDDLKNKFNGMSYDEIDHFIETTKDIP